MNRLTSKQKKLLRLSSFFIAILVACYMFYGIVSVFNISVVYIEADPILFPDTKFLEKPRNLLFLSATKLKNSLLTEYPLISEVTVIKQYPMSLRIRAIPKLPLAIIEHQGATRYFDQNGNVVKHTPSLVGGFYPKLDCPVENPQGKDIQLPAQTQSALHLTASFQKSYPDLLNGIVCSEDGQSYDLSLTSTAMKIRVSKDQNNEYIMSSLQFLLKQFRIEGSYPKMVDLRFEKPVISSDREGSASSVQQ